MSLPTARSLQLPAAPRASAHSRAGSKTRIGVFDHAAAPRVGARACRSRGARSGKAARVRQHASAIPVFENWNRYYDPFSGRYLQPEPVLQNPIVVQALAMKGHSMPTYSYAGSNPLRFVDVTGLTIGILAQDFSEGSDAAQLVQMLEEARTDPCSRDLVKALEDLPDQVLIRSGSGSKEDTIAQTDRAGKKVIIIMMDSEYMQFGEAGAAVLGTGVKSLVHELYHALLLSQLSNPDLDADSQHMLINGKERTGRGKRMKHSNLKSLMDEWEKCRCKSKK